MHRHLIFCFPFFFLSCSGPIEKLGEREQEIQSKYLDELAIIEGRETEDLSWTQAVERMLANNLELKRSRESIRLARQQTKQIYWDLIPIVGLRANLSRALQNLGGVQGEDIRLSVFSTINLPGLVSLYSRRYSALLADLKAELDHQLKSRQLIIRLRDLFLEYEDFRMRRENQQKTELLALVEKRTPLELINATPESLLVEQQAFEYKVREDQLRQKASLLLGSFERAWNLVGEGLPELNYTEKPIDLKNTKDFGVLLRKKQAMELEVLRLSEVVAKLGFFPDLNFGVYSPLLYDNLPENYRFSADRIIINAVSSVRLDTSLSKTRNLRRIREQLKLQDQAMLEEINRQIQESSLAQRELALVEKELSLTELRIEATDSFGGGDDLSELREFLEKRYLLVQRASSLHMRKARLEGGFWLLDESKWSDFPKELTDEPSRER